MLQLLHQCATRSRACGRPSDGKNRRGQNGSASTKYRGSPRWATVCRGRCRNRSTRARHSKQSGNRQRYGHVQQAVRVRAAVVAVAVVISVADEHCVKEMPLQHTHAFAPRGWCLCGAVRCLQQQLTRRCDHDATAKRTRTMIHRKISTSK